ncbi:MAG: type IX secretion system membrane protein PorP/SprF [Bacteroidota bacterium]
MKKIRWHHIVVFLCAVLVSSQANAQQRIVFSQYMFHGLSVNPAYTGSDDFLNVALQARNQWVGLEGAPTSQLFTLHGPLKNRKHIGLGVVAERQQLGVSEFTSFFGTYAYQLSLGRSSLAFGLQAGLVSYNQQLSALNTQLLVDPNFVQDISILRPNAGAGLYLKNEKYYLGLSVPYLIQNTEKNPEGITIVEQNRHYFFSGGYLLSLSRNFKLKPNFLVQAVDGIPLNVNVNLNGLINDVLWLGVSYQLNQTFTSLVEVLVNKKLSFGFSYDFTSTSLNQVSSGSPEIFLTYRFVKDIPDRIMTPRYF